MMLSTILIENKLEQAIDKYNGTVPDAIITQFYNADPTETKKYFNWMITQFISNQGAEPNKITTIVNAYNENLDKVIPKNIQNLNISDRAKKNPKDINSYTLPELDAVAQAISKTKSKTEIKREGADVIYEGDRWLVLSPLNQQASCYYGSGTKWCTAARDNNRFDAYNQDGFLIYFLDKTRQEGTYYRMALHVKFNRYTMKVEKTFYDAEDHTFKEEIVGLLPHEISTPVVKYIDVRVANIKKKYVGLSIEEIREMMIEEILRRKRVKVGRSVFEFSLDFNGSLGIYPTKKTMEDFLNISALSFYATPLYDNRLDVGIEVNFVEDGYEDDENHNDNLEQYYNMEGPYLSFLREPGHKDPLKVRERIDSLVNQYIWFIKDTIKNFIDDQINTKYTSWSANASVQSMAFKYPPKKGTLTDMFIKYVIRRQRRNLPATKRHFYQTVLGYSVSMKDLSAREVINLNPEYDWLEDGSPSEQKATIKRVLANMIYNPKTDRVLDVSGQNSMFFSALTDSGILARDGKFYKVGPNYEVWTQGDLVRL